MKKIKILFAALLIIFRMAPQAAAQGLSIGAGTTFSLGSSTLSLNGHWSNAGTFAAGWGAVVFSGASGIQTIANASGETFYNLTVNKAADDVRLLNNVTATGTLAVASGDVDLNGNVLTLGSSAMLSESAGARVKGSSGYITTTRAINAPSGENVAGMGAVITSAANLGSTTINRGHAQQTGKGNVSILRYYDIVPTNNASLNATLVFNYYDPELNALAEAGLILFKSIDNGASWTNEGGVVTAAGNYLTKTGIPGFSRWTLAASGDPLSGPPDTPVAIAAAGNSHTGFSANWNTAIGATGYRLDVSTNSAFTSFIPGFSNNDIGNVLTYSVTGLSPATAFYYRIRAYNIEGTTVNSNTITAYTTPAAPVATPATAVTNAGFSANWNAATGAAKYYLDVSTDAGFGAGTFAAGFANLDIGNVVTYPVTGLSANIHYYYRVRSANAGGSSGNSNTVDAYTVPATPVATAATNILNTGFSANWTCSSGAAGYRLDVATDSGFTSFVGGYQNLDVGNVLTLSVSANINPGTQYHYRVRGYSAGGTSVNSNTIAAITTLAAPVATPATDVRDTSFRANWNAVPGAAGYRIDLKKLVGPGMWAGHATFTNYDVGDVTTYLISEAITSGGTFGYRVRAYTAAATSPDSNFIEVTTVSIVLSGIEGAALDYSEGSPAVPVTGAISLASNQANLAGGAVQITGNYQNGGDVLSFTNQNGISGSWDAAAGRLTLSGSSAFANYQTALRAVQYGNTNINPSALARTVSFTVNDGVTASNTVTRQINFITPGIDVRGNGVSIADGDPTPSTTDGTEFGGIDTTSGSVVRTFAILNTGTIDLTLTGTPKVVVGGPNAADFTVTAQPVSPVAAGGSTAFQVTFKPSATGLRTATLSMVNNDPNENPYDFAIQGTGILAPAITSLSSATFTVGAAGTFIVTASGCPAPALSQTGALPTGVSFTDNGNGTATLAGTPAAGTNGTYAIVITAANGVLPNATQNFTLTVTNAPAITSLSSATFMVGVAGTFTVTAAGTPAPALSQTGALPTGVSFTDNGNGTATLAGTPAIGTNGTYPIVLTAANGILPNATQNFTLTVKEDSDSDGIPDHEEQGPDGTKPDYDGNKDGTPDWKQDNVTSFHIDASNGGSHYIQLAIPPGQHIDYVYVPRAFDTPPPEGVSFPYGFFSFTLGGIPTGGATTMTIYLDGEPPQTYYKYGKTPEKPTDHWYEFAYDGQTGAEVVGSTVVLHLVDGMRGDHDLEADGKIADPGGPAEIAPHAGLYLPYLVSTADEKTEIGIISTKGYASTSTISYYGENGDLLKTSTITLGPHGKAVIPADTIPSNSASAIVSGDGDPVGYTRYVNASGKRCAWTAATALQKSFAVPHTAADANWATVLGLFNPGDEAVEVTLIYESGASGNFTLNAKSRRFIRLTEAESAVSIASTGYISAMEMFESLVSGGDAAALLLSERSLNALYVPSILHGAGEFTGIGLTSYHNGIVHIVGRSASGGTEEISLGTQPLGVETSRSRMAFNLSRMLGDENLWAGISGVADFSTPVGTPLLHFQGVGVYGKENTGKLGAVNLNALRFREGFVGIGSTASESILILLNPGTQEATIAVTGYNASGEDLAGNTMKIAAGSVWTGTAGDLFNAAALIGATHVRIASDVDLYGFETINIGDRMEMMPVMEAE